MSYEVLTDDNQRCIDDSEEYFSLLGKLQKIVLTYDFFDFIELKAELLHRCM